MRYRSLAFLFTFILLIAFSAFADEAAPGPAQTTPQEISKQVIREKVLTLRGEKIEKMPYLNRSYIKDEIRKETIQSTLDFLSKEDLTLADVVQRAVAVDTSAVAAKEKITLAKRRILVAMRDFFPEAGFKFEDRVGQLSGSGFQHKDFRLTFRQPIFRGGVLWNTFQKERRELSAQEKEYEQIVSDLIKDAGTAYFEYQRAMRVVKDHGDALQGEVKRQAGISEKKWNEKIISEIEHLNVQSIYSEIQYDYETVKQELEIAKLDLQKFLDLQLEDDLSIASTYQIQDLIRKEGDVPSNGDSLEAAIETAKAYGVFLGEEIPSLDALIDTAYQNRAELQMESARLDVARLDQKIRWGEMLPEANIVMEYGKLAESYTDSSRNAGATTDPPFRREFRLFLELSWNLAGNSVGYNFENDERAPSLSSYLNDSGSQQTRNTLKFDFLDQLGSFVDLKQAQVDKLEQIARLEDAEKEVVKEVKEAYFNYKKALIQLRSTLKRINYQERMMQLSMHKLESREIEISEYLESEKELLEQKADLHKAIADYLTARVTLNHAVGVREFMESEADYVESN